MNAFKKLITEFNGISGTITKYTSDPQMVNFIAELKLGIEQGDYEIIEYYLNEITNWYDANLECILANRYVFNKPAHKRTKQILEEIKNDLKPEDCIEKSNRSNLLKNDNHIIFISHNSSDKKYADALRDFIIGLGVNNNQLIYTSHPLHKIPMDKNIYDYLRDNISSKIFMIILWSDDYLNSPACLNEMGAAWVTQSDYTNVYVPNFSFGNPKYHECAVDTRKMGAVLNGDAHCKASLIELKNKIQSLFSLKDDEQKSLFLIDEFIKKTSEETNNG